VFWLAASHVEGVTAVGPVRLSWRVRRAFEAQMTHTDRLLLVAVLFLLAYYGLGIACRLLQ